MRAGEPDAIRFSGDHARTNNALASVAGLKKRLYEQAPAVEGDPQEYLSDYRRYRQVVADSLSARRLPAEVREAVARDIDMVQIWNHDLDPAAWRAIFTDPMFDIFDLERNMVSVINYSAGIGYYLGAICPDEIEAIRSGAAPAEALAAVAARLDADPQIGRGLRDYLLYGCMEGLCANGAVPAERMAELFLDPVYAARVRERAAERPAFSTVPLSGVLRCDASGRIDTLPDCELLSTLAARHPGKVLYVDFCSTWCGPCRRELKTAMPILREHYAGSDEVRFVTLCLQSRRKAWSEFLDEFGLTGLGENYFLCDEASMIDVGLASQLFAAVDPERTRVIVLGDPYQLAAVGPGAVYADLADEAGALRFCRAFLTVSRRYGAASPVGRLARLVNDPDAPVEALEAAWEEGKGTKSEVGEYVRFAPAIGRGGEISSALREWMRKQLRNFVATVQTMLEKETFEDEADYRRYADAVWRALSRFRLLAAQRSGRAGVTALNEWAAEAVSSDLGRGGDWFAGFVLIVRTNDDTIGLFNGDAGVCLPDPENPSQTIVWFGDKGPTVKECAFAPGLLPRFDAAYAMTIHQSQGSEFDEVAIILPEDAESSLATRELLYTGVTRAKRGAVIFGRKEVFLKAATTPTLREGGLSDRLREFRSASDAETQNA